MYDSIVIDGKPIHFEVVWARPYNADPEEATGPGSGRRYKVCWWSGQQRWPTISDSEMFPTRRAAKKHLEKLKALAMMRMLKLPNPDEIWTPRHQ